jgi:hypothetical protein
MILTDLEFDVSLLEELKLCFTKYISQPIDKCINLAGINIVMRFSTNSLAESYFPALKHLEIPLEITNDKAFLFYIIDSVAFNKTTTNMMVKKLFSDVQKKSGIQFSNTVVSTNYYLNLNDFSYYYSERERFGFWIVHNIDHLSNWHFANPFRFFWYDFLARKNIQVSHVAAVSNNNSAVLLSGGSGAGKSTTALACLEEGLNFLGDDHCIFSTTNTPEAFSLYNSLKIDAKKLFQHPDLSIKAKHFIDNLDIRKAIFYLNEQKNDYSKKPIRAILKLNRFSQVSVPSIYKISQTEVLQSMTLSTISQCPWVSPKLIIENHKKLVEKIEGYCLCLSTDLLKNAKMIRKILNE